jgi:hypothetical protein
MKLVTESYHFTLFFLLSLLGYIYKLVPTPKEKNLQKNSLYFFHWGESTHTLLSWLKP